MLNPATGEEISSVLTRILSDISDSADLAKALRKKKVAVQLEIEGVSDSFVLSRKGGTVVPAGGRPQLNDQLITIIASPETAHSLLAGALTFNRARHRKEIVIAGASEDLGWILAYLGPIQSEYRRAFGLVPKE